METFIVKITDEASLDLIQIYNFIAYYATDEKQQIVTVLRIFYGKRDIETLIQGSTL